MESSTLDGPSALLPRGLDSSVRGCVFLAAGLHPALPGRCCCCGGLPPTLLLAAGDAGCWTLLADGDDAILLPKAVRSLGDPASPGWTLLAAALAGLGREGPSKMELDWAECGLWPGPLVAGDGFLGAAPWLLPAGEPGILEPSRDAGLF